MKMFLDDQDVKDSIHVATAFQRSVEQHGHRMNEEEVLAHSRPHEVQVEAKYSDILGFNATGRIDGRTYRYDEQGMKDAIGIYMAKYYSFDAQRLLITLGFENGLLDAQVEVLR